MAEQQYSHIQKKVGEYVVSYGVIQSINDSCDTIDFFKISDSKYGFYLADVAGPSKQSIISMNALQELINKNCIECLEKQQTCILDPAVIANKINNAMYNDQINHLSKYITLIYGILDLSSNIIKYTTAGYYPNPILITKHLDVKHAKYLFSTGFPLGIVANANYKNFEIKLAKNDALIFFSDGIMRFFKPDSNNSNNKDDELLQLVYDANLELANVLEKLNLNYNTPIVDDIVVFILQRT